jgi:hypothetical protein
VATNAARDSFWNMACDSGEERKPLTALLTRTRFRSNTAGPF